MARVKRSVNAHKKRREVLEQASGYRGQRSRLYRKAKEQLLHSGVYAYRDRRAKKGDFRRAVDPADQRCGPCRGHDLQPLHLRSEDRRGRGRPQDPRRPRGHRPGRVRRPGRGRQGQPARHGRRLTTLTGFGSHEPIVPPPASAAAVRSARRLLRRKERLAAGEFLAEGRQAVSEALAADGVVRRLLVAEAAVDHHQDLLRSAVDAAIPIAALPAAVVARADRHRHPAGSRWPCAGRSTCRWPRR